ncbi:hypothetical protein [Actinosynnema sp. NPDC020468]|uniref:alpha/beta fold hydrolase n=1 Tax=Actinosynnema sp. NPDC020468 TaxID=3154488 RepID=UPI0033E42DED
MRWPITRDYRATLPASTLVYVRGAGHSIATPQPELYLTLIRNFLADRPLPLPDYAADAPPR